MLGAIIGDIVGSIYERNPIKTKDFELFGRGCHYTDDTVMTLAVADAVIAHKTSKVNFKTILVEKLKHYGKEYPTAGYGSSFIRWIFSESVEPYNSFGNGSAMRVSACGLLFDEIENVKKYAKMSAEVTHNHPDGIKGAEATAVAINLAKGHSSKETIKHIIENNYYEIPQSLNELRKVYSFDVTCKGTVPAAILAFLEANSFEDAIRNAVSLGRDSDTLAAITGSIAGAYYGIPNEICDKAITYLDDDLRSVVLKYLLLVNKRQTQRISDMRNSNEKKQILFDSISGCLFGGAIGDALGYPVEFMTYKQIVNEYGEGGICEFDLRRSGKAQISDDTQMTLFTANGILFGETRKCLKGIGGSLSSYIFKAYQEWYKTQTTPHQRIDDDSVNCNQVCWIYNREELHDSRAPGNSCLSAIAEGSGTGSSGNPINNSKGCGGVMRVAPIGCFYSRYSNKEKEAALDGAECAALTHGHTLGYIPAAFISCLIYKIITSKMAHTDKSLYELVSETMPVISELYSNKEHYSEFEEIINKAVFLSKEIAEDVDAISQIGQGWVAEEALAISLYAVLKYSDRFNKAIICAVNHDGDSDSTGAIAGNILGAYLGLSGIDQTGKTISKLELYDVIYELSQDLACGCRMSEYGKQYDTKWMSKYVFSTYGK